MVAVVAFQGVSGAYSELAARRFFGRGAVTTRPCPEFKDVYQAVLRGGANYGVLPVENALTGSIHQNYDLLLTHKVWIVGEVKLPIEHCLLTRPGTSLAAVRTVYSHPQALAQCAGWLRKHRRMRPEPYFDTAGAAAHLATAGVEGAAAIASAEAAKVYGLKVAARGIADHAANFTRFLVVARRPRPVRRGPVKTSVVFALKNIPGALYKSLGIFALRDLDLVKIESRPIPGQPWKYLFYLDFIVPDARAAAAGQKAVGHLEEISESVRVLGSYAPA